MKGKILIAGLLIAAVGGFFAYNMYNAKTATAGDTDAEVTLEAPALFAAFLESDTAAGKLYNEKVIQISGTVQRIETAGKTNVYFGSGDPSGAVICEFDSTFKASWAIGQQAVVKGICAGFSGLPGMGDVILQRCAAVE